MITFFKLKINAPSFCMDKKCFVRVKKIWSGTKKICPGQNIFVLNKTFLSMDKIFLSMQMDEALIKNPGPKSMKKEKIFQEIAYFPHF